MSQVLLTRCQSRTQPSERFRVSTLTSLRLPAPRPNQVQIPRVHVLGPMPRGPFSFRFLPYPMRPRIRASGVSARKGGLFHSLPVWGVMVSSVSSPSVPSLLLFFHISIAPLKLLRNLSLEGLVHPSSPFLVCCGRRFYKEVCGSWVSKYFFLMCLFQLQPSHHPRPFNDPALSTSGIRKS